MSAAVYAFDQTVCYAYTFSDCRQAWLNCGDMCVSTSCKAYHLVIVPVLLPQLLDVWVLLLLRPLCMDDAHTLLSIQFATQ